MLGIALQYVVVMYIMLNGTIVLFGVVMGSPAQRVVRFNAWLLHKTRVVLSAILEFGGKVMLLTARFIEP